MLWVACIIHPMDWLTLTLRALVAVVFGLAGFGKLRNMRRAFAATTDLTGWSGATGQLATLIVVMSELSISLSLLIGVAIRFGFAGATALLGVFTIAQARSIRSGRDAQCACFGSRVEPVSGFTIARNLVLIVTSTFGALLARESSVELVETVGAVAAGLVAAMVVIRLKDIAFILGFKSTTQHSQQERSLWP